MPGTLADTENVIVDVGTGFYVEKVCCEGGGFEEERLTVVIADEGRCGEVLQRQGG